MVQRHADYRRAATETRMAWEPATRVGGAHAPTQNDEMEWDKDVHHIPLHMDQASQVAESSRAAAARQHPFASSDSTPGVASHGTAGSIRIIRGYTDDTLKDHLIKLKDALGLRTRCPPCWISSLEAMHNFDHCPDRSKFSTWKGLVEQLKSPQKLQNPATFQSV